MDNSNDTLGRWMSHYIAELMLDAEKDGETEQATKMQLCYNTILSLWQHRHAFMGGGQPFKEFEPILRALESLDPDNEDLRYFRPEIFKTDGAKEEEDTHFWINLAKKLDYSARILIRRCLVQAAPLSPDKSKEWLKLVDEALGEEIPDSQVIHKILNQMKLENEFDSGEEERKRINDTIERLESFSEMALEAAADLRQRISGP